MPPTVQRRRYSPWLQVVNGVLGLTSPDLHLDAMMTAAAKSTGLNDFGGERFLEPLGRFVDNFRASGVTALARVYTRAILTRALANRLYIQDYVRRHPEVLEIPIEKPLFIIGFPRTGTTLLQNVLAMDSDARGLHFWELTNPIPRVEDRHRDVAQRKRRATFDLRLAYLASPEMGVIHHIRPESLEECWSLMANSFCVLNFDLQSALPDYGDWLLDGADMEWAYREYKVLLQILQHQHPGPPSRLVLKCPEHLWFCGALLQVFPDAQLVWTHRDPAPTIASYCSLVSLARRTVYGRFEPLDVGAHITRRFHQGVSHAMDVRKRVGDQNFLDLKFKTLVQDPAKTFVELRKHFRLPEEPLQQQKIDEWNQSSRLDKQGKHIYDMATWGVEPAAIHRRFADYLEAFLE